MNGKLLFVSNIWLRLCLSFVLLGLSQSSWALVCKALGGSDYMTEDIGSISVPNSVPDGTIIWRSQTYSIPAECWKTPDQYPEEDDPIYFYGNPAGVSTSNWGIEFGMVYKGRTFWDGEWSSNPSAGIFTGSTSKACPGMTFEGMKICSMAKPVVSFQVVIRKRGLGPMQQPTMDTYDVFQLDGKHGLWDGPSNPHRNFRYQLRGLSSIVGTACSVEVTARPYPGNIDFGVIYKSSGGGISAVQPKDFNLELEKKCDEPIKIGAVFLTSYLRNSNTILPKADSQFGIQIRDSNNNLVPINEPFPLMSFGAGQSPNAFVPFTASLTSFGNPEEGPFEAIMVVQVVYY